VQAAAVAACYREFHSARKEEPMLFYKAYEVLFSLRARLERQEGQALVEYALILALIAVVSILVLTALGKNVSSIFGSVNSQLSVIPATGP
jgi:pilus assembly protein Flp/PilA